MKKHIWFICFSAALIAFSTYIALDTFVIPRVYNSNATEMNTSLFTNIGKTPVSGNDSSIQSQTQAEQSASASNESPTSGSASGADYQDGNISITMSEYYENNTKIYVNPTGRFVIGGPQGDSGLTGRKIIVDTYGGSAPHGGGAFSGKDPTKVDRSAAYAARWVAKTVVAAGLAKRCQVQLAYAIGVAQPVSILVETFGTGTVADSVLENAVRKTFDLRPTAIIRDLDLQKPIYRKLAAYGHMGREDLGVAWEKTDRAEALKAACR